MFTIDMKFKETSAIVMTVGLCSMVLVFTLILFLFRKPLGIPVEIQHDISWKWLVGLGIAYTIADYLFFNANHGKVPLVLLALGPLLIPVVGCTLKFLVTGDLPNLKQFAGYLFIAIGTALVLLGGKVPKI